MFNWLFKKVVTFREKVAVDLGEGDTEKPFLDHLDDLRSMIVRMTVTLLVVTIVTFLFIKPLIGVIIYPLEMAGIADKVTLQNFKVIGGFMTAMNIALVAGVILAFPLLLYFLLQFVLPGLRSNEKKVIFPALGVGGGLFLLGVIFAYFVVTPRALTFFYEFSRDIGNIATPQKEEVQKVETPPPGAPVLPDGTKTVTVTTPDGKTVVYVRCCESCKCGMPQGSTVVSIAPAPGPGPGVTPQPGTAPPSPAPSPESVPAPEGSATAAVAAAPQAIAAAPFLWELTEYVKFICQFVLIFGACFELPVVVMALVKLDVLNYKVMKTSRAWAAIIICVVAALITPTQDALTLALLAVPMYVLYEICIWLAWWLEKRDRQIYPEYYKEQDEDAKALEVADDWDNENYNPWSGDGGDDEEEDDGSASASKPKPSPTGESKPDSAETDSGYSPPEAGISGDSQPDAEAPNPDAPADEYPKPDEPADDSPTDKRDTD